MSERPTYVSEEDLENQALVMRFVSEQWEIEHDSPVDIFAKQDHAILLGGKVIAIAEVKCRTNSKGDYPYYKISRSKVATGLRRAYDESKSFLLIVRWQEGIFFHICQLIDISPERTEPGGRVDRHDPLDTGDMSMIRNHAFERVTNEKQR